MNDKTVITGQQANHILETWAGSDSPRPLFQEFCAASGVAAVEPIDVLRAADLDTLNPRAIGPVINQDTQLERLVDKAIKTSTDITDDPSRDVACARERLRGLESGEIEPWMYRNLLKWNAKADPEHQDFSTVTTLAQEIIAEQVHEEKAKLGYSMLRAGIAGEEATPNAIRDNLRAAKTNYSALRTAEDTSEFVSKLQGTRGLKSGVDKIERQIDGRIEQGIKDLYAQQQVQAGAVAEKIDRGLGSRLRHAGAMVAALANNPGAAIKRLGHAANKGGTGMQDAGESPAANAVPGVPKDAQEKQQR